MSALRNYLNKIKPNFQEGGKLHAFESVFDGFESFLYVPNTTAKSGASIHDSIDSKRISGKQRKATLEEYQQTFLQVPRIDDRKPVFVSSDVRDRLDRVVRILGGRRMSVSGIIENILLVTGENPAKAGTPYLAKAIDIAKKYFSNVKIEVMPLSTEDYKTLADHGMNGVICFQETYNHEHYKLYHPRGMKSKFEWRCDGFDRMGMAGVHSIGMGVLIGLEKEWRTDVVMMAHHLRYLQKHYWKTKYSVNFPRMRPAQNEGFQPNCFMTDKQLAQATFAMRIFDHDVDISYSTREPAYIRDNMATLGVTTMSAESKVNPGGYHTYPQALEQFTVSDERTAKVINARLKELGREPVWKDWDASFDLFGNIANG